MTNKVKTFFMGTPDFGVPTLEAIINDKKYEVIGVISQPDKKVGRKQLITKPAIKVIAEENNIPVYQPKRLSEFVFPTKDIDLIVVVAYAQIIPASILNLPKYGCINVHGSLLPKHRGASCIQGAIINGDKKTGITIMEMDAGLDTGPMIIKEEIELQEEDTTGLVFDKLSKLGGYAIVEALDKYISKEIIPEAQDDAKSNYCPILKKSDGEINWNQDAEKIERHIRAMAPWPGAFSQLDDKTIKIIKTNPVIFHINEKEIGTLFTGNDKLFIQCQENAIEIREIQLEGKKIMTAQEFLNGHQKYLNLKLGKK